jgi:hypothetical protein
LLQTGRGSGGSRLCPCAPAVLIRTSLRQERRLLRPLPDARRSPTQSAHWPDPPARGVRWLDEAAGGGSVAASDRAGVASPRAAGRRANANRRRGDRHPPRPNRYPGRAHVVSAELRVDAAQPHLARDRDPTDRRCHAGRRPTFGAVDARARVGTQDGQERHELPLRSVRARARARLDSDQSGRPCHSAGPPSRRCKRRPFSSSRSNSSTRCWRRSPTNRSSASRRGPAMAVAGRRHHHRRTCSHQCSG